MPDGQNDPNAQKLFELIRGVRICMMTTAEPDGSLHSRPMYNMEADEHGNLWFFSRLQSPKVAEIAKDRQVNLAFADPDKRITSRSPASPRWCATRPRSTRNGASRCGPGSRPAR